MKTDLTVSIILPAYNEAENIEKTVSKSVDYVERTFKDYEVVVVNDGSFDGTREIVDKLVSSNSKIRQVNHSTNLGYGAALRSGFETASLQYVFFMDSDGQFEINDLDGFIPFLENFDIAIGFRENRADSFIRKLNALLYHLYIRIIFGLKVSDIDCAFKMFPKSAYGAVKPIKSGGALFSAEFLIRLYKKGFKIKEIPVRHFPREFGSQSGANLRVILRMFKESWKMRHELKGL